MNAHAFNHQSIRDAFPGLQQQVRGKPLIYLDSAASAQTPQAVVDAITHFHLHDRANVHRGVHLLSQRATVAYEGTRAKVRGYINARSDKEILYTAGTTASINLVAQTFVRNRLREGDRVLITAMEHHSNIVPWQMVCESVGAHLDAIPIDDRGQLILDDLDSLLGPRTKFVSIVHVSNALGTVNPVKELIAAAHAKGIPVLLDGAQAVPHGRVDVQDLDVDFYAFSGHKLYGPTGIGILYGKEALLEAMPPYQGGGDMIRTVTLKKSTWAELPHKFEAGTPNICGAIGLGAAIDYLDSIDLDSAAAHEADVLEYGTAALGEIPGLRMIGTAADKAGVLSFVLEAAHSHDVGTILDMEGIAVRTGHHCAQPVMDHFGIPATARASLGLYNNRDDIDVLVRGLHRVVELFS